MSVAQGQFTIVDYNDAVTLTGYIGSNLAKTQMYNPDNASYNPDWTITNLVLTPSLYVIGTTSDIITNTAVTAVKWYEGNSTTAITATATYGLSGTKSHILTIKTNVLAGLPGKDYRCEISYTDPTSGLALAHVETITFSRVVNGGGIVDLVVTTPSGNVFKNTTGTETLTAKAELWRGSTVDTTSVTYQWYKQDASVTVDEGGGVGWDLLVDAAGSYAGCTTNTLTVYASKVDSYATFKCIAKDTDATSNTYNTTFVDTASFIDNTDPIQIIITSTGGDKFRNGVGTTTLAAKLYQNGAEIDSTGSAHTYTWTRYNSAGTAVNFYSGVASKTGKTLAVDGNDVDVKGTFLCTIS